MSGSKGIFAACFAALAAVACGGPKDGGSSAASGAVGAGGASASQSQSASSGMAMGAQCWTNTTSQNCVCQWVSDMPVCVSQDGKGCTGQCPAWPCCVRCKTNGVSGGSSEQCQCANLSGQDCDLKLVATLQAICPTAVKVAACP